MAIRIDTKYARRDVERMKNAMNALQEVENYYNQLLTTVEQTYKGEASQALCELIAGNRVRKTKEMIQEISDARKALADTIIAYEKLEKEQEKLINGD